MSDPLVAQPIGQQPEDMTADFAPEPVVGTTDTIHFDNRNAFTLSIPMILAIGVAVALVVLTLGIVIGLLTNHDPSDALVVVLAGVLGVAIGAAAAHKDF